MPTHVRDNENEEGHHVRVGDGCEAKTDVDAGQGPKHPTGAMMMLIMNECTIVIVG